MSSLTQRAASGVRWSAVSQFGRQGIGFITTSVLARALAPTDFGLMGMVLVVTGFAVIFKDLGTSAAIVQRKDLSPNLLSSIFWINVGFGVAVTLLVIALSPAAGIYFKEPRVEALLCGLAPTFFISSLSTVQQSILQRDMEFNVLARVELISTIIGAVVGIGTAFLHFGVWSLVLQSLAVSASNSIGMWTVGTWKPALAFCLHDIKTIVSFSGYLMLFSTFNYFARNADNMLIGRYLGPVILGYYALSYRIMQYPLESVSGLYGRVLFPAFAKLQNDNDAFRNAYLRSMGFIAIVTFPMMLGLCVLAKPVISLFLSDKWLPIVPAVQILSIVGLNQSLATTVGNIYMSKGRTGLMFSIGIITSIFYVAAIVIGLQWGMIGVVICYAIADFIITPFDYYIPFKLIHLPLMHLVTVTWRPLLCSLIMALFLWSTSEFILLSTGKIIGLTLLVAFGAGIYLLMNWYINRRQLQDFVRIAVKLS